METKRAGRTTDVQAGSEQVSRASNAAEIARVYAAGAPHEMSLVPRWGSAGLAYVPERAQWGTSRYIRANEGPSAALKQALNALPNDRPAVFLQNLAVPSTSRLQDFAALVPSGNAPDAGHLRGVIVYRLKPGDCLFMPVGDGHVFHNPGHAPARYCVVLDHGTR